MGKQLKAIFFSLCVILCGWGVPAVYAGSLSSELPTGNDYVKAELIADRDFFAPPASPDASVGRVGILFKIEPGWHIYWHNSGDAALPTKIHWTLPQDWTTNEIHWPLPLVFDEGGGIRTYGYKHEALLFVNLFAPPIEQIKTETLTLRAKVEFLVCKDICIPGAIDVEKEFNYSAEEVPPPSKHYALFESAAASTPQPKELLDENSLALSVASNSIMPHGGNAGIGGLLLQGLSQRTLKNIEGQIQVFPDLHKNLNVGRAGVTPLKDAALITFPVTNNSANPDSGVPLTGIIALSPEITGRPEPLSISWSIPFSSDGAAPVATGPDIRDQAKKSKPLSYLVVVAGSKAVGTPAAAGAPVVPELPLSQFLAALALAFIAGMILNLMPCVLPVIAIKVMSFVNKKKLSKRQILLGDTLFTAGILSTFLALALIVTSLRAAGVSLGWGFQFQEPIFVLTLIFVVFILSLGFFDVYCFTLPGTQAINKGCNQVKHPLLKQFLDGVLATLLATPCTGPFLGFALAVAFVHPAWVTISIFLSIGLGLALPYVYLSTHPKLLSFLPAPGPWMLRLKEFLGFLLLGTVCWLLSVLNSLAGSIEWTLALLLLVYFYFWTRKGACQSLPSKKKLLVDVIRLAIVVAAFAYLWPQLIGSNAVKNEQRQESDSKIAWQVFSPSIIESAASLKSAVFLEFTADWCITCKVNETFVIERDEVAETISRLSIIPVKADWTMRDETITKALRSFGSSGVPLYVVLPKGGGEPIVLPVLLTTSTLIEALEQGSK